MSRLSRGLYENLISEALESELDKLDNKLVPRREESRDADAGDRIALLLARLVERAVGDLGEKRARRTRPACRAPWSVSVRPVRCRWIRKHH
jgi:hypothetical protein